MSEDEVAMHVVNGSEVILDDNLLNNSIEVVTINNKQLLIGAYRPSPDDEVCLHFVDRAWLSLKFSCKLCLS